MFMVYACLSEKYPTKSCLLEFLFPTNNRLEGHQLRSPSLRHPGDPQLHHSPAELSVAEIVRLKDLEIYDQFDNLFGRKWSISYQIHPLGAMTLLHFVTACIIAGALTVGFPALLKVSSLEFASSEFWIVVLHCEDSTVSNQTRFNG